MSDKPENMIPKIEKEKQEEQKKSQKDRNGIIGGLVCCFCEYKSLIEQHFFICNKLNRYGILMFKVMCSGYIWEE